MEWLDKFLESVSLQVLFYSVIGGVVLSQFVKLGLRDLRGGKRVPRYIMALASVVITSFLAYLIAHFAHGMDQQHAFGESLKYGPASPLLYMAGEKLLRKFAPWMLPAIGEGTRVAPREAGKDRIWTDEEREMRRENTLFGDTQMYDKDKK